MPTETMIEQVLRDAIRCSGSINRVALEAGLWPRSVHRFVQGGGITLSTVEKLLEHFGYELVKKKEK
jgi:hypothetical protein